MKTRKAWRLVWALHLAAVCLCHGQFSGGSGTSGSPYLISNASDLAAIKGAYLGSAGSPVYYRQTADIDLSGYPNWQPIGTNIPSHLVYDGNHHSISNLTVSRPSQSYAGLFSYVNGGISDLALVSGSVSGASFVGSLLGMLNSGTIEGCRSSVSVSGTGQVGGLVGYVEQGEILNSCQRGGSVTASGNVAGGIAGYVAAGGTADTCYAACPVSSGAPAGGLVGFASADTIFNSYWDTTVSGQATSDGGGSGVATAGMMQRSTFSGWDFGSRWNLYAGNSYPYLQALADTAADPVVTPGTGEYAGASVSVTVTCATAGVTLHYSLDRNTPDDTTATSISSGEAVSVPIPGSMKVVAFKAYVNPSSVTSASYDPASAVATPVASPGSGEYPGSSLNVTLTCATADAVIRYTTDDSEPEESDPGVSSGATVAVPVPGTLKARAWKEGLNPSATLESVYAQMPTVATPVFSPGGGTYTGSSLNVTLTCATADALIRYTTDGSNPDELDPGVSSGTAIAVSVPGTLKAKAWRDGYTASGIQSADYESADAVSMPVFSPAAGAIAAGNVSVTVTCATAGATIRYTTDGSDPDGGSPAVENGQSVLLAVPGTLKAWASAEGLNPSAIQSGGYTTAGVVETVTFAPVGGPYAGSSLNVTLSCATAGAVIRYTTDGSDPLYGGTEVAAGTAISVSLPASLMARAFSSDLFASIIQVGYYGAFAGGSGTVQDPYRIATADHLNNVRDHLGAHFALIDDIDLGVSPWNTGDGWQPIGADYSGGIHNEGLEGTVDGHGHVVSNLFIDRQTMNEVGLFGYIEAGAIIRNFGVASGSIQGAESVGGMVGYSSGSISNCFAVCEVVGSGRVGGLIGDNAFGSSCVNSYSDGSVSNSGVGSYFGGLVGYASQSTVGTSYSVGSVTGVTGVGGMVGESLLATIDSAYWDTEASGVDVSAGGSPRTTAQMQQQATFSGWDFTDIWRIEESVDYPRLRVFDHQESKAPDAWLIRFYGDADAAPEVSVKGNPLSCEYIAGTDPSDADSLFLIDSSALSVSNLTLSVMSMTGRVYGVQSRGDLLAGEWAVAAGVSPKDGTGDTLSFALPAGASNGFYRVTVRLAD